MILICRCRGPVGWGGCSVTFESWKDVVRHAPDSGIRLLGYNGGGDDIGRMFLNRGPCL